MKPVAHWLPSRESGKVARLTRGTGHETPGVRRTLAAPATAAATAAPAPLPLPGRKPLDYLQVLTGILFVLKTGIAWDDLPAELGCGCGKTCRHYLRLWYRAGVWQRLHALLLAELNGADQIDWQRALIDASFVKAP